MATLNIGGQRISIDDGFLQLAPEQQQATVEEIAVSLPKSTPSTDSGSVLGAIDSGARQLVKGIPVLGGAMDKIAAAGDAATYSFLGRGSPGENFSERYAKNKISEAGKDAAFETVHPNISTALQLTGGVAGTLPLAATTIGARGLGLVGSTGARVAQGAAGGAAIGAGDAATRGNDVGAGTLVGGALGGFSPFLGRVAGAAVERFARGPTPDALQGFQPKAVDKVTRALTDDAVDPAALQQLGAVQRGSQTRGRQAAGAEFPSSVAPVTLPGGDRTLLGIAEQGIRGIARMLGTQSRQAGLDRQSSDAARLLSSQGTDRDRVVQALIDSAARRQRLRPRADATQDIATLIGQSGNNDVRRRVQR